jgi:hypothetical protein
LYATKNPYIDPKLNKHKKNWLHNFNGGILTMFLELSVEPNFGIIFA